MTRHWWSAVLTLCVAAPASAQRGVFEPLRRDGNGVVALSVAIRRGFDGVRAGAALRAVADDARLNLTIDPTLSSLDTAITIAAHVRSAAVALLEIADASRVALRISSTGQILVVAAPTTGRLMAAATDTAPRPPTVLPAMRSEAGRVDRQTFETTTGLGQISITARDLAAAPRFFAEADVLRAVQTLPGVEARNDYSAGMNVQGGEADQNLVLLDGYPIYNPFHLGGVFGTFIEPAVGRVDLSAAGFPIRYDGRLSGVLDVRSSEATRTGVHGSANVSLISTSASVGGAWNDGNGSWSLSARRTYLDAFLNFFKHNLFPYHFQDGQTHLTRVLPGGVSLSATAYAGGDAAHIAPNSGEPHDFSWGNQVVGLTIAKTARRSPFGDSAAFEQRFSRSAFATDARIAGGALRVAARVIDSRADGEVTVFATDHQLSAGYDLSAERLRYSANQPAPLVPVSSSGHQITAAGVFVNDQWRPRRSLIVDAGVRIDDVTGVHWHAVLPRVAVKYFVTPDLALSAAAGVYAQWMRSLAREDVPIRPLDLWVAADSTFPPSRAYHAVVGLERWLTPTRFVRVEGFLKHYRDLVEPNAFDDTRIRGDEFDRLEGRTFGGDVLLRQLATARFNGWLSYTFLVSTRTDAAGFRFSPGADRRHDLNVVANWRFTRYTVGARYAVATGTPYTPITGSFERRAYDPATHAWRTPGAEDRQFIVGARDSERLPLSSRADVSITRESRSSSVAISPYLSIVNVLAHNNVYAYGYDYSRTPPFQTALPGFPLFPTVGVAIAW